MFRLFPYIVLFLAYVTTHVTATAAGTLRSMDRSSFFNLPNQGMSLYSSRTPTEHSGRTMGRHSLRSSDESPIHILVPLHVYNMSRISKADVEKFSLRIKELDACLTANVYNPYVARVHVVAALHDDAINGKDEPFRPVSFLSLKPLGFNLPDEILGHEKLTLLASSGRPTLRNMIQYANSNLKADSVMVISNSDIFWSESLRFVRLLKNEGDEVFALSRHDMIPEYPLSHDGCPRDTMMTRNHCLSYTGSHDGFAFRVPIRIHKERMSNFEIPLGLWNVEPTFIALLRANGFSVKNPCIDIRGIHYHCSLVRTYTPTDKSSSHPEATVGLQDAWDVIGGIDVISQELGENFHLVRHGHAPATTIMELCRERADCWSRAIKMGFNITEKQ